MSSSRQDRTVHAWSPILEVVRYDRSGKWYLERKSKKIARTPVRIDVAVKYAMWCWYEAGGSVEFGRPGGGRFDQLVRRAVEERNGSA